jgi:APA family basic amino acid/polyamine antiporter
MKSSKQLSLFDIAMIVVSLVIGMGIFRTPSLVAAKAQIPELFYLSWIVGGFVALCGALTYAEIGSRYPVTGGYYKIFSVCYHPSIAFAINCIIVVSNAASMAGVALIGAEYLNKAIFPESLQSDYYRMLIALTSIILFYFINLLGLRTSSRTQNVLTLIKLLMVLTLVSAIFFGANPQTIPSVFHAPTGGEASWSDYGRALGLCLIAVSFSFGGYQQTINFGGEAKNANRVVPRAIFLGMAIIIALYLSINYAYVNVIGFEQLKSAESIAAILAGQIFGPTGFTILSVVIFLSVLGYVNVNLLSNPRAMYAMGEERALPAIFAQKTKKQEVMVVSLTLFTILSVFTLFYAKTFDKILNYTMFMDGAGMIFSAATIFFLRRKTAHLDKNTIYSMKLYPLLPIIFIAAYLFVAISIYQDDPAAAINGIFIFGVFVVLYFIAKIFQRKKVA